MSKDIIDFDNLEKLFANNNISLGDIIIYNGRKYECVSAFYETCGTCDLYSHPLSLFCRNHCWGSGPRKKANTCFVEYASEEHIKAKAKLLGNLAMELEDISTALKAQGLQDEARRLFPLAESIRKKRNRIGIELRRIRTQTQNEEVK